MNLHRLLLLTSENRVGNAETGGLRAWSRVLACIVFMAMTSISVNADEWANTYEGGTWARLYHVDLTTNGGYIVLGRRGGLRDSVWIVKTDSVGDTLWTRAHGDTVDWTASCVQQTDDGGYIIAGQSRIDDGEVLLIKTDSLGDTLWTRTYGGPTSRDWASCVRQTPEGGYIVIATTDLRPTGPWLIKTDSLGDTLWTRTYGSTQCYSAGYWVEPTHDGGYIISAKGGYLPRLWLIKTDSLGDTLWTRTYLNDVEAINPWSHVQQTSDSGYVAIAAAGTFGGRYTTGFLIKVDQAGDTLWRSSFDLGTSNYTEPRCVRQTYDGGYVVVGWSNDWFLLKADTDGKIEWTKMWDGMGYWGVQAPDSGYTMAGSAGSPALIHTHAPVGTEEKEDGETRTSLSLSAYPNPVFNQITIKYRVPEKLSPQLKLYDLSGAEVHEFSQGECVKWRVPAHLASGYYFLRLEAGPECQEVVKITILR